VSDELNGRWTEYRGALYIVEGVARHTTTSEEFVVFRNIMQTTLLWLCPKTEFLGTVVDDEGRTVQRFVPYRLKSEG
jgi:hypothetical protein